MVWLDLDQAALDDAYDQHVWAPNFDQLAARRHWLGEVVRAEHYNHFEMLETFASPYAPVGRAILAQMALAA